MRGLAAPAKGHRRVTRLRPASERSMGGARIAFGCAMFRACSEQSMTTDLHNKGAPPCNQASMARSIADRGEGGA